MPSHDPTRRTIVATSRRTAPPPTRPTRPRTQRSMVRMRGSVAVAEVGSSSSRSPSAPLRRVRVSSRERRVEPQYRPPHRSSDAAFKPSNLDRASLCAHSPFHRAKAQPGGWEPPFGLRMPSSRRRGSRVEACIARAPSEDRAAIGELRVKELERDLDGRPSHRALLDERAQPIAATARIWSGSDIDGRATHDDCAGWTNASAQMFATTGTALQGDPGWGGGDAPLACSDVARLLCFQD